MAGRPQSNKADDWYNINIFDEISGVNIYTKKGHRGRISKITAYKDKLVISTLEYNIEFGSMVMTILDIPRDEAIKIAKKILKVYGEKEGE